MRGGGEEEEEKRAYAIGKFPLCVQEEVEEGGERKRKRRGERGEGSGGGEKELT